MLKYSQSATRITRLAKCRPGGYRLRGMSSAWLSSPWCRPAGCRPGECRPRGMTPFHTPSFSRLQLVFQLTNRVATESDKRITRVPVCRHSGLCHCFGRASTELSRSVPAAGRPAGRLCYANIALFVRNILSTPEIKEKSSHARYDTIA